MIQLTVNSTVPELRRKIKRVFRRFPKQFDSALKNAGGEIATEVKKQTPKVTTSLSRSIRSKRSGKFEYTIKSRNVDGLGTRPENYVDTQEDGRGVRRTTKNRNRRARRSADGGYHMFVNTEKKAKSILRKRVLSMAKRIARKI